MKKVDYTLDKSANSKVTMYFQDASSDDTAMNTRPFILVIPGGGYSFCSEKEAEPVALSYLTKGYHAGVLYYHVGKNRDFKKSLNDGKIALELIKSIATTYYIDTSKIVVVGFSAGGHLAAAMSTMLEEKPNLCILGYPAILKSFANVMQIDAPDLSTVVSKTTPPTFLFSTASDNVVPIENSLIYLKALEENEVPFESHIFQIGKHGLSLANKLVGQTKENIDLHFAKWFDLSIEWLELNFQKSTKEVRINNTVDSIPIKLLVKNTNNKDLLLKVFPSWRDKSTFKIVKSYNLKQIHEMFTNKLNDEVFLELKSKLVTVTEKEH